MYWTMRKNEQGFTLIEIVAVLAILGTLAIAFMPSLELASNRTKDTKMISDLTTLDSGVRLYRLEHESYPADLAALIPNYIPNKTYKDAENEEFSYETVGDSYSLTGHKSDGTSIKADGTVASEK